MNIFYEFEVCSTLAKLKFLIFQRRRWKVEATAAGNFWSSHAFLPHGSLLPSKTFLNFFHLLALATFTNLSNFIEPQQVDDVVERTAKTFNLVSIYFIQFFIPFSCFRRINFHNFARIFPTKTAPSSFIVFQMLHEKEIWKLNLKIKE